MSDVETLGVIKVVHPVIHHGIPIPLFRFEAVFQSSANEGTRRHVLVDAIEVEGIGVETEDLLAGLVEIVPDERLPDFVMAIKDDGRSADQILFNAEVDVTVGFVEQSKRGTGLSTGIEEHPAC